MVTEEVYDGKSIVLLFIQFFLRNNTRFQQYIVWHLQTNTKPDFSQGICTLFLSSWYLPLKDNCAVQFTQLNSKFPSLKTASNEYLNFSGWQWFSLLYIKAIVPNHNISVQSIVRHLVITRFKTCKCETCCTNRKKKTMQQN